MAKSSHEIDERIGFQIRARRIATHKSQEALANQVGVTFQQIQKYENGSNRVSGSRLVQIAKALDITVAALVEDGAAGATTALSRDDPCSVLSQSRGGQELARAYNAIENNAHKQLVVVLAQALGGTS
jgi:transcriptional regulator with XRE-family HTH domain